MEVKVETTVYFSSTMYLNIVFLSMFVTVWLLMFDISSYASAKLSPVSAFPCLP